MPVNILRVVFGLVLVLFLPGWTMINLMFPRKGELDEEFDGLYRVTLGMAMSIAVVILIGFVLGNPGLGYAPNPDPDLDDDGLTNDVDEDVDGDGVANEMAYLFDLQLSYDEFLGDGQVDENLTQAFREAGYSLSGTSVVTRIDSENWKLKGWLYDYKVENTSAELKVSGADNDDDGDGVVDAEDDSPQGEVKGWFQTPYIVTALLSITALFFVGGWWRGAYPRLGRVHPKLARAPPGLRVEAEEEVAGIAIPEQLLRVHGLKQERQRVKEKLELTKRKLKASSGSMRAYYSRQEKVLIEDLADIDGQLAELEAGGQAETGPR